MFFFLQYFVERLRNYCQESLASCKCFFQNNGDYKTRDQIADWFSSLTIYILCRWRTQVRGPSFVWMLCSQPSSAPTVSWLSANQSEPSLLSQSQQPFPLFGRDVECADVEPCNSILLNKSSRSFLRKHIEFHQKYPCSRNPLILKITERSLLPFPGCGLLCVPGPPSPAAVVPACSAQSPAVRSCRLPASSSHIGGETKLHQHQV